MYQLLCRGNYGLISGVAPHWTTHGRCARSAWHSQAMIPFPQRFATLFASTPTFSVVSRCRANLPSHPAPRVTPRVAGADGIGIDERGARFAAYGDVRGGRNRR